MNNSSSVQLFNLQGANIAPVLGRADTAQDSYNKCFAEIMHSAFRIRHDVEIKYQRKYTDADFLVNIWRATFSS